MKDAVKAILASKEGGGKVVAVAPGDRLAQVVERMNAHKIGSVLVMEGERLVGIFTERDVLVRVVAAKRDPETTLVGDVMTKDPMTIEPSVTVQEAMRLITDKRFRHLPVAERGKVVGMVSIGDLTGWVIRHYEHEIQDLVGYITGP
jgi:CBS domain-containing protein